ncbi:hypothetical protein FRC06_001903 [Ceratobasidium sp. 370]|nr:hypothetical protein FRC06_001903 [Ceratobasidium sp. 370]
MSSTTSSRTRTPTGIPSVISTAVISSPTPITAPNQPTSTDSSGGNALGSGSGTVNSTLYLFTFLTTLLLLLAVSCGIVIRSFVLRRRFHRRVEEAIAAGATDLTDTTNSVQVAVLIAMPDPSKPRYIPGPSPIESHADGESSGTKGKQRSSEIPSASTDEHELPDICIGVAQAQVADSPAQPTAIPESHNSPKA